MNVLCFGELLLRYSPELNGEWIRQAIMPVFIGGAELNTATALACWKTPVAYCTALPENYLSKEILGSLQEKGIDTSRVLLRGKRIGAYFLPQGRDLKNEGVIYDRAHSSFWDIHPGETDWTELLKDVSWFQFSAISPALNANVAAVCREALEAAKKLGVRISVDLNYRSRLWQWGKHPREVMPELVECANLVMGNIWAAKEMLGIQFDNDFNPTKENCIRQAEITSAEIMKRYPQCDEVANTFRFDSSGEINYYATLYQEKKLSVSKEFTTSSIVDKVGSGDTFMAGLIYGTLQGFDPRKKIEFAAAAAFNKLFVKGDATTSTVEEIMKFANIS